MRDIKFRIWDGEDMDHFTFDNDFDCHTGWLEGNILMQYTGLKDRKGQEIYDGDVLRNETGRVCKIVWNEHCGSWDSVALNEVGDHFGFMNNQLKILCEIMGNIHENPELLTTW